MRGARKETKAKKEEEAQGNQPPTRHHEILLAGDRADSTSLAVSLLGGAYLAILGESSLDNKAGPIQTPSGCTGATPGTGEDGLGQVIQNPPRPHSFRAPAPCQVTLRAQGRAGTQEAEAASVRLQVAEMTMGIDRLLPKVPPHVPQINQPEDDPQGPNIEKQIRERESAESYESRKEGH